MTQESRSAEADIAELLGLPPAPAALALADGSVYRGRNVIATPGRISLLDTNIGLILRNSFLEKRVFDVVKHPL